MSSLFEGKELIELLCYTPQAFLIKFSAFEILTRR